MGKRPHKRIVKPVLKTGAGLRNKPKIDQSINQLPKEFQAHVKALVSGNVLMVRKTGFLLDIITLERGKYNKKYTETQKQAAANILEFLILNQNQSRNFRYGVGRFFAKYANHMNLEHAIAAPPLRKLLKTAAENKHDYVGDVLSALYKMGEKRYLRNLPVNLWVKKDRNFQRVLRNFLDRQKK